MQDQGGGWELATILWATVTALIAIIGAYQFLSGPHQVNTWLILALLFTNCATLVWVSRLRGQNGTPSASAHHPTPGEPPDAAWLAQYTKELLSEGQTQEYGPNRD